MPVEKLELSIHASKLKNVAGAFKGISDPFAVVTQIATGQGSKPKVLGKTEVLKNTLNPNFAKVIPIDYELGTPCKIAISLHDEVRKGDNKNMGSAVFDVGEVLGARGNTKARRLKSGGTIFAHVRKSKGCGLIRLKMKAMKLKNTEGFLRKSDPFFEISRKADSAGGQTWDNIYRSKPIMNNLDPVWDEAIVEISHICGGELDKPVKVEVFDYASNGRHVLMGMFESSVNGFVEAAKHNTQISLKKRGVETGKVVIMKAEVTGVVVDDALTSQMAAATISPPSEPAVPPSLYSSAPPAAGAFVPEATFAAATPSLYSSAPPTQVYGSMPSVPVHVASKPRNTFVDYVSGGCEFNVCVAIDFTGSNGDPRRPGTLHYLDPYGKNDYEKAISSIVGILAKYDSDQLFPVWGFGAKYGGIVRHLFQCGPTQEASGVDGILSAYRQTFSSGLVMSGPTCFIEVIQAAAAHAYSSFEAAQMKGSQAYTILLIVTDGAASDINATAACIDQIADAPLSIVIVGVGSADFSSMQFLDDFQNQSNKRDITQFVEFNRHSYDSVALSSETLGEIPDQLTSFFGSKGIAPLPPIQKSDSQIIIEPEAEEEIDLALDFNGSQAFVASGGFLLERF